MKRKVDETASSSADKAADHIPVFTCCFCGRPFAANDEKAWTAGMRAKMASFSYGWVLDREIRCKDCGEVAKQRNLEYQAMYAPMTSPTDKCCQCGVCLEDHLISKSQKSKRRGDRRFRTCAERHTVEVHMEDDRRRSAKAHSLEARAWGL